YLFTIFIKRNDKQVLFGNWCGDAYSDNSKYLFQYLLDNRKDLKLIWIGKDSTKGKLPKSGNVVFINKASLKAIYYILTSKFVFVTQGLGNDLSKYLSAFHKSIKIQLWHGVPIKYIGKDMSFNVKKNNANE